MMKRLFLSIFCCIILLSGCSESSDNEKLKNGNDYISFISDLMREDNSIFSCENPHIEDGAYLCDAGLIEKDIQISLYFNDNDEVESFSMRNTNLLAENMYEEVILMDKVCIAAYTQLHVSDKLRNKIIDDLNQIETNYLELRTIDGYDWNINFSSPTYTGEEPGYVTVFNKPLSAGSKGKGYNVDGLDLVSKGNYSISLFKNH